MNYKKNESVNVRLEKNSENVHFSEQVVEYYLIYNSKNKIHIDDVNYSKIVYVGMIDDLKKLQITNFFDVDLNTFGPVGFVIVNK